MVTVAGTVTRLHADDDALTHPGTGADRLRWAGSSPVLAETSGLEPNYRVLRDSNDAALLNFPPAPLPVYLPGLSPHRVAWTVPEYLVSLASYSGECLRFP
jgi:hypothetical protein